MKKKMSGIIILASIAFCCFGEGKTIKSMTFATPEKSKLATWTTNNAKIAMKKMIYGYAYFVENHFVVVIKINIFILIIKKIKFIV